MAEHGRGAWPNSGAGGTKDYKANTPGPYYYIGSGDLKVADDPDAYAVRRAVRAYQGALNRRLGKGTVEVDGHFGKETSDAVTAFQTKHKELVTPWGGIGTDTSFLLLYPDLIKEVSKDANAKITPVVVSGVVRHESSWDAGAVGYVDNDDLGLAQINGRAHPDLTRNERLRPQVAFKFIVNYLNNALAHYKNSKGTDAAFKKYGVLGDAIASYNLGIGGADRWISQGRPEWYTPQGATSPRNVWDYIEAILVG